MLHTNLEGAIFMGPVCGSSEKDGQVSGPPLFKTNKTNMIAYRDDLKMDCDYSVARQDDI